MTKHDHEVLRAHPGALSIELVHPGELRLTGELVLATTPALTRAIGALRRGGSRDIVLDVRHLDSVDSTGLAALLEAHRHGPVSLRSPTRQVLHLLRASRLDEWIRVTA